VSDDRRDRLQALSETHFKQKWRLEVMIAIAGASGTFTLTSLAEGMGLVNISKIQSAFDRLKDAGLIVEVGSSGRDKPMKRVPSKVWPWVLELEEQAAANSEGHLAIVSPT